MKKNVLVFGAAGFIGTYLVDALAQQGHSVVASDLSDAAQEHYRARGIPFFRADITARDGLQELPRSAYDAVIHLAAMQPANFDPRQCDLRDYIDVNVVGTLGILEFARRNAVGKVIYASSHRNTSGLWHRNQPIREDDGRAPQYQGEYAMFAISESAAQDCVEVYRANFDLSAAIFRLPPVYGYGPHLHIYKEGIPAKTGFQTLIDNAMACRPLEVWGDSSVGRDIVYVKDVVSAFLMAIDSDHAQGLYNISSGYRLTLREEAETIARVFWGNDDAPVIVERPDIPHTMDAFVYDNAKARREFGWQPRYSFEQLLHDYAAERESQRFAYLVDKRNSMFAGTA